MSRDEALKAPQNAATHIEAVSSRADSRTELEWLQSATNWIRGVGFVMRRGAVSRAPVRGQANRQTASVTTHRIRSRFTRRCFEEGQEKYEPDRSVGHFSRRGSCRGVDIAGDRCQQR